MDNIAFFLMFSYSDARTFKEGFCEADFFRSSREIFLVFCEHPYETISVSS